MEGKKKLNSSIFHTKEKSYLEIEESITKLLKNNPIPDIELAENLFLFITPQNMRRLFFHYEMYKKVLSVPGNICLFGVRWGRGAAIYDSLRTLFEPFNHGRKIICFDSFEGLKNVSIKDDNLSEGQLETSDNYDEFLNNLLRLRNLLSPIGHIKQYEIHKGDASSTLSEYLKSNPQTVVSLAHLDMNLYEPTKDCLRLLKEHVTRGSIIIIDELSHSKFPGQTIALDEIFGKNKVKLKRIPYTNPTWTSYFICK